MAAARPDVAIYLENLDGGGVQAMRLNIARELQVRGFRPELVVSEARGALAASVPAGIEVVELPPASRLDALRTALRASGVPPALPLAVLLHRDDDASFRQVPALVAYLRRARPRTLLAATPYRNLEALLACRLVDDPPRVAVSEHNDLRAGHPLSDGAAGRRLIPLQRWLYPAASALIAVSRGVAEDVARRSGVSAGSIHVVYNPVVTPALLRRAAEPPPHPWLDGSGPPVVLGVGRLSAAKDFGLLVEAFGLLRRQRPARLVILGQDKNAAKTARRHEEFRAIAARHGAEADVAFPGFADNPFAWMAHAGVLAVSSRHEGFCNVIAEALACGCPVVSTDCPSGPAEILEGGRWGRLVPVGDAPAMALALAATLAETPDRDALRRRAQAFSLSAAVDRYAELLFGTTHAAAAA